MSKKRFLVTTLSFKGPRFDDHSLDVSVLPEILAYQKLLVETAKELWRKNNPDKERLPKGFEDQIVLKFDRLLPGSVALPLDREVEFEGDAMPLEVEDEVTEASTVIDDAIEAAAGDRVCPESLPAKVIPLFGELGKTLREDEHLETQAKGRPKPVAFDSVARERMTHWEEMTYTDSVDLIGEVTSADVEGCGFSFRLDNGQKVQGKFAAEQEAEITEALKNHKTLRLRVEGTGEFVSRDASLRKISQVTKVKIHRLGEEDYDPNERPLWEFLDELAAGISEEELDALPKDGARNLDEYLS